MTTVADLFARRATPGDALRDAADTIAGACRDMALRFRRGGRLLVFGNGGAATDAQHIAVEFTHPVVVGKAALPALSLTDDVATLTAIAAADGFDDVFAAQVRLLASEGDIALGLSVDGRCGNVLRGLEDAHRSGLLTVALLGGDGGVIARSDAVDHAVVASSDLPCVVKELHVTTYHIMWELVHVLLEQPALPSAPSSAASPAPSSAAPRAARSAAPSTADAACVTCADAASPARVRRLLDGDLAVVETATGPEEVSVALVAAEPGDVVLVHAGEAIAVRRAGDEAVPR